MGLKEIQDFSTISSFITTFSKYKDLPVFVSIDEKYYSTDMMFVYKKNKNIEISINKLNFNFPMGSLFKVTFLYNDILFSFQTTVLSETVDRYIINKPQKISMSSKRISRRYNLTNDDSLYIQLKEFPEKIKPLDISLKGLSFKSSSKILSTKKLISNIKVNISKNVYFYIDAKIIYCRKNEDKTFTYGIYFTKFSLESYYKLFKYISKKLDDNLKIIDEIKISEIRNLYDETKEISFNWDEDSKNSFNKKIRKIYKLKEKHAIFCGVVQYKNGKLLNIGSTIRIYDKTFLMQDFLSTPEASFNPKFKTEAYISLASSILSHPYFEHFMYYNTDSAWNEIFEGINRFLNNSDKFIFDMMESYEFDPSSFKNEKVISNLYIKELKDPTEFINYCSSNITELESSCYNYSQKLINLKKINRIHQVFEACIYRKIWAIEYENTILAYIVAESYSDLLDITGLNNICRIYFNCVDKDVKPIIKSVLPELLQFYKGNKFTILFKTIVNRYYNIEGLKYSGKIGRIIMNKNGLFDLKRVLLSDFSSYIKYYPLTHPQRTIWNMEKAYPNKSISNNACTIELEGHIDHLMIEMAINIVIEKNDALRTKLTIENEEPIQYFSKFTYRKIDYFDFRDIPNEDISKWENEITKKPFKLINRDLYYFALLKISDTETKLYIKIHHLVIDGWGMIILINEIMDYYSIIKKGYPIDNAFTPTYAEYILNEEDYKYSNKFNSNKFFWNSQFSTIPEYTSLKETKLNCTASIANRKTFIVDKNLFLKIQSFSKCFNVSAFSIFMSLMYIYIYRITMKEDIVLGTPILNRASIREKNTIGMFIGTLPVRIKLDKNLSFRKMVELVSKEIVQILKHQKYPMELILKDFREKNKTADHLYDTIISFQNASLNKNEYLKNNSFRWIFNGYQSESLILHINDRENNDQFILDFDYRTDIFSLDEINKMFNCLINILQDGVSFPEKMIYDLEILSHEETNFLLHKLNDTFTPYPNNKTIQEIFEEKTVNTPTSIAAIFTDSYITYSELNARANQIARLLRKNSISVGSVVGIITERCIEMLAGILGILKSGGTYLPIEPSYPKERIQFLLQDTNCNILLVNQNNFNIDISFNKKILSLNDDELDSQEIVNLDNLSSSDDIAYILYTSGSTGIPKGVQIKHKSIINILLDLNKKYPVGPTDSYILKTNYTFDISVTELFGWFIGSGKLVILPPSAEKNIECIIHTINSHKVTHVNFVPSVFRLFLDYIESNKDKINHLNSIKYIFSVGEAISPDIINKFYSIFNNITFENLYGPTEATIYATSYSLKELINKKVINVPIGKPLSNMKVYVLDKNNKLLPHGIPGELFIGGEGIAIGYLNRPELNTKSFIKNPYNEKEIIYKTGDLVRWLPDNNLEFLGRIDHQIKIHGFRIELGEIENCIMDYPLVQQAVVVAKEDSANNKYLCAYISAQSTLNIRNLKLFLSNHLPYYMIPSYITVVNHLPVNSNGKINRKLLMEDTKINIIHTKYIPPKTSKQVKIVKILQNILKVDKIGMLDNFFELGGDSLKAMHFISKISQKLNLEISFKDIFDYPIIENLIDKCIYRCQYDNEESTL